MEAVARRSQRLIAELPERSQAVCFFGGGKFNGKTRVMDHVGSMYGIFIYLHLKLISMANVGVNIPKMDPMGYITNPNNALRENPLEYTCASFDSPKWV